MIENPARKAGFFVLQVIVIQNSSQHNTQVNQ